MTRQYHSFIAAPFAGIVLAAMLSQGAFAQGAAAPGQASQAEAQGAGAGGGSAPGQAGGGPETGAQGAALGITQTTLTAQSHQVAAGASAGNLEGAACTGGTKMISGACHPGYNDRMTIINQFPNISANTWRCGFKNNTGTNATVWIYTLCAQ